MILEQIERIVSTCNLDGCSNEQIRRCSMIAKIYMVTTNKDNSSEDFLTPINCKSFLEFLEIDYTEYVV